MSRPICFIATLILACAALAAPAPKSKPFISGWGTPVNPDGDCRIKREKDALIIEMPDGDHDYDPRRKKFNAPRLFYEREIEGDFVMQVRVRIDCRSSIQPAIEGQLSSVSAGFLQILPNNSSTSCICNRLELRTTRTASGAEGYVDLRDWRHRKKHPGEILEGGWKGLGKGWNGDAYLRLERQRGSLGFSASLDGEKWTVTVGTGVIREKLKVGLAAYTSSAEPSKVRFDQLKITRGKNKEPLKKPLKEFLGGPAIYKASP